MGRGRNGQHFLFSNVCYKYSLLMKMMWLSATPFVFRSAIFWVLYLFVLFIIFCEVIEAKMKKEISKERNIEQSSLALRCIQDQQQPWSQSTKILLYNWQENVCMTFRISILKIYDTKYVASNVLSNSFFNILNWTIVFIAN